jgi:capsular polysaccharide biosynthesis protein/MinD-like ATPase involved in chromosome partitioning or flagellar assembly
MNDDRLPAILWRGRALIATSVLVCLALAIVISATSDKAYEARAVLRVNQAEAAAGDAFNDQQASQSFANTFATMIGTRSFMERIAPRVDGGALTAGDLQGAVSATAVPETSLLGITAQAPTPQAAQRIANDVATQFIAALRDDAQSSLNDQQQSIEARIGSITTQIEQAKGDAETSERVQSLRLARNALTEQLANALGLNLSRNTTVSLIGPPTASAGPVKPRTMLNLVAGLLLGALIGAVLAGIRSKLDDRVRSGQHAAALLDLPMAGSVPLARGRRPFEASTRNALAAVWGFLQLPDHGRRGLGRVIVVCSPGRGDGKTSVARGLAEAAAVTGADVVLVDGDLERGELTTRLGLGGKPGLGNANGSGASALAAVLPATDAQPFAFLPAGPTGPDPLAMLHGAGVTEVFRTLAEQHDVVIVDTPAARAVPDALGVAAIGDTVVVVGRAGRTRRGPLSALVQGLTRRMIEPAVVMIEPRSGEARLEVPPRARRSDGPARARL